MSTLATIYSDLYEIALKLDSIPKRIQEVPDLDNRENILLIGKALSHIFELQNNIQMVIPDLKKNHKEN
jgi:predicted methyltransferase